MTRDEEILIRSVPATPDNVATLRHAVTGLARRAGAGTRAQGDVALALGEACGNVVIHAYPPGDVGPLIVEARVGDGELEVVVSDEGRGMTPHPATAGLGLGLPLMSSLAKVLTITDGEGGRGTDVRMTFALDAD
jgi:anti-sigma regulatory factor (Ser/Thr protein kinase)